MDSFEYLLAFSLLRIQAWSQGYSTVYKKHGM
jgi:hypothetical protein